MARAPLWIYLDIERLAEVIDGERTQAAAAVTAAATAAAATTHPAAPAAALAALVRRSAAHHGRVRTMPPAAVRRLTRAELRRELGPVIDALDDDELRAHATRVLTTATPRPARN